MSCLDKVLQIVFVFKVGKFSVLIVDIFAKIGGIVLIVIHALKL